MANKNFVPGGKRRGRQSPTPTPTPGPGFKVQREMPMGERMSPMTGNYMPPERDMLARMLDFLFGWTRPERMPTKGRRRMGR